MKNVALFTSCILLQCLMTDCLFVSQCHRFCGLNGSKCLRKFGLCLCDYGWTGPNAVFITSGPNEDRILADYCIVRCQYSHLYRNPNCTGLSTPPPLPTKVMTGQSCHNRCGPNQLSGQCLPNDKCLCWWGRTGANAVYINAGVYKNRIVADNCNLFCRYNHLHRNPDCVASKQQKKCDPRCELFPNGNCQSDGKCMCWLGWTGPNAVYTKKGKMVRIKADYCNIPCHYTNNLQNPRCSVQTKPSYSLSCDPRCKKVPGQGICQSDGHCLCWWGWTGPNARYIVNGNLTNRIVADYCTKSCHYTHDYLNTSCASIPLPRECNVPPNSSTPLLPCKPQCGAGVYRRGKCLSNGQCLCWWGWTGPNSCFVDEEEYKNRIIADYCNEACHYTHDYRNNSCIYEQSESSKTHQLQWSNDIPSPIQNTSQALNTLAATKKVDDPTTASLEFSKTQFSLTTEIPVTTKQPSIATKQLSSTEEVIYLSSTSEKSADDPIGTTDDPIRTAYGPISATDDPIRATDDPIIATYDPIRATDDPIRTADQQSSEQVPSKADQQLATSEQLPNKTEQQVTKVHQQYASRDRQSTTTDRQSTLKDRPSTTTDRQSNIKDRQPTTTDSQSSSKDRQSTTTDRQSTTTDRQSTTTDRQSSTKDRQSTTTDRQSTTKDRQSTTTDRQSTTTDRQSTTTDRQSTTTDQPTLKEKQLHTTKTKLFSTESQLLVSTELPDLVQQATMMQRMFTTDQQLATGQKLTTTEHTSTTEHNPTSTEKPSTTIETWPTATETKPTEQNRASTEHLTTTEHQPTKIEKQSTTVETQPTPTENQATTTGQNLASTEHFITMEQPGTKQKLITTDHPLTTSEQKTTMSSTTEEKYTITEELLTTKEQHTTYKHLMATLTTTTTEPQEKNTKSKHRVPYEHVFAINSHEENISSPSTGNSITLAIGIIAIVCALIGLVFMLRYNMKCTRKRTGYSKLGEEAYFLNEEGTNHEY